MPSPLVRHFAADNCFHSANTGGRFKTGDAQLAINGMLPFRAMRTEVTGTPDPDGTDYREKGLDAEFLETGRVTA